MSDLPSSWTRATFGDVATVVRGVTFPASAKESVSTSTNVCCLRTSNIQREVKWDDVYFIPRAYVKRDEQFVAPGDVLMSMANSYELVGKVAIANEVHFPTAFGAFLSAIRPTPTIDGRFLFHLLRSDQVQRELRAGSSQTTNIANISVAKLSSIEAPLAPIAEQTRIADKLDAVLARVDACRNRLNRIPTILKRFRQSVLAAGTSGALTEDWRTENAVVDDWQPVSVQTVAHVGTGSTPLRSNPAYFAAVGTPWITSAATSQPLVTTADEFVTSEAISAHRLKTYPVGTLLVAMYGEGKTRGQVTELDIPATINQACAAVVVDESKANRAYVKLALQANYFEMRELAEGGNQPNLNLSKVKEFPLSLPDLVEQTEIVRRVETLFAFADRLEARYTAAHAQVEKLTPSLLAKAFRGELVPQDPNDEPASELLARVRATTGRPTAKATRGRKSATAK